MLIVHTHLRHFWQKMKVFIGTSIIIHLFWNVFLLFLHSLIHTDNLTNSLHFTVMSVIKRECTHAIPLSLMSRSSLSVCRFGSQLWSRWHWRVSGAHSLSAWERTVAFYPPSTLSPLLTSSLPPDLHTYITPNWTSRGSWKMLKRRRGTIIHVAQPLMQICLLMSAFSARRICLMPILYMSATWPWCPIALSMRSGVRFVDLMSGLFLWCGQKTMNWVARVSVHVNVLSDLLCLSVLCAVYQDKWKPW